MTAIPTIETARLRLRPFRESDDEIMHELIYSDPDVMRYLPGGEPRPRDKTRGAGMRVNEAWSRNGIGFWACETLDGEILGHAGLNKIDATGEIEVLYGLSKAGWGHGYATEAAAASLRYGFEVRGLDRIIALAHPDNEASQHVMRKIGMTFVREDDLWDMHLVVYEIDRSDWKPADDPFRLISD